MTYLNPKCKMTTPMEIRDVCDCECSFGNDIVFRDDVFVNKFRSESTRFFPTLQLWHGYGLIEPLLIAEISHPSDDHNLIIRMAGSSKDMRTRLTSRRESHRYDMFLQLHVELRHPHVLPTRKRIKAIRDLGNYFQEYIVFEDDEYHDAVYPKTSHTRSYFPMIHLTCRDLSLNPIQIVKLFYPNDCSVTLWTSASDDRMKIDFRTRRDAYCFYRYVWLHMKAWNPHTPLSPEEMRDLVDLGDYLAPLYIRKPKFSSLMKGVRKDRKKGRRAELVDDEPVSWV